MSRTRPRTSSADLRAAVIDAGCRLVAGADPTARLPGVRAACRSAGVPTGRFYNLFLDAVELRSELIQALLHPVAGDEPLTIDLREDRAGADRRRRGSSTIDHRTTGGRTGGSPVAAGGGAVGRDDRRRVDRRARGRSSTIDLRDGGRPVDEGAGIAGGGATFGEAVGHLVAVDVDDRRKALLALWYRSLVAGVSEVDPVSVGGSRRQSTARGRESRRPEELDDRVARLAGTVGPERVRVLRDLAAWLCVEADGARTAAVARDIFVWRRRAGLVVRQPFDDQSLASVLAALADGLLLRAAVDPAFPARERWDGAVKAFGHLLFAREGHPHRDLDELFELALTRATAPHESATAARTQTD